MKCFIQIPIVIIAVHWCCEVKCKPFVRKKHIHKTFHLGFGPLPPKHFSLVFEKFAPFGPYEIKHEIKKRQIAPPVTNEVLAVKDDPLKIPMTHLLEKTEVKEVEKLPAEVLITSVVEPLEPEAVVPPGPPPVIKEVAPVVKEEKPVVVKEEIPPVVKEEIPPVVKEEPPPNFFVKSSRFVLYFGSMMLQMLSRFVNGEINLNSPLPPPLPGIQ
ncbi:uncharacterized protein LOC123875847 [Maniola jurtina]|uniref:uncharacterized protein LOC123875847 n=1 Tax=Maniola jurtina TaxID=191418 RepID=UPI001E68EA0D|nr:uncharacterized protein LOC123875847 [Maniola jurtina]